MAAAGQTVRPVKGLKKEHLRVMGWIGLRSDTLVEMHKPSTSRSVDQCVSMFINVVAAVEVQNHLAETCGMSLVHPQI